MERLTKDDEYPGSIFLMAETKAGWDSISKFHSNVPNTHSFYGNYLCCCKKSHDSTGPGRRQEQSYAFFVKFLDIIRCPVKLSYYFKFHGARTAFCKVFEGILTSAGHRLHTSDGHRTILVWISNRTISTAVGQRTMCEKSKELSKISIQIGRCPSGHRPMFYESNCHRWEATCICTYWICIDSSLVKTKNLNSIIYVSLEELRMSNMHRKSAIEMFAIFCKCCFHIHHCQGQHQCFSF